METTRIDLIKALYAYTIAAIVVVGGGGSLILIKDLDANTSLVIAGFIGSALTFVFGQEVATRSARQSAAATLAATNGHSSSEATA